ncbi:type IV pilus assembly protein PilM [candidate division NPL-UPA2 bacterium]|nr:type IV pilus assembly protein PilM [candidate division NPL-UPA2 bacterium]
MFQRGYSPLALDIGTQTIKLLQLRKKRKNIYLNKYNYIETPPGSFVEGKIVDADIIAGRIRSLFKKKGFRGKRCLTSLSGESVTLRSFTLPKMTSKELAGAIHYEVEKHIMLSPEEVVYDYMPLRDFSEIEMEVLLVAASREIVDSYMDVMQKAKLYPLAIEVDPFALIRLFRFFQAKHAEREKNSSCVLLDIGANASTLVIIEDFRYAFSRTLPFGGNHFTRRVMAEEGMGQEKVEKEKKKDGFFDLRGAVEAAEDLALEVQRTVEYYFYKITGGGRTAEFLYLTGGGAGIPRLTDFFTSNLDLKTFLLDPESFFGKGKRVALSKLENRSGTLSTAVGVALRGWENVSS